MMSENSCLTCANGGYILQDMNAVDFASAPRIKVATLHLTFARTMDELSEMSLDEIGRRAVAAGYRLGHKGKEVSLRTWTKHGAQNVYAVAP